MEYDVILFDFDYTIADATEGIVDSANYALRALGLPEAAREAIRHTVGMTLEEAYTSLTGKTDADEMTRYRALYVERGNEVMTAGTVLFPDTKEALARLQAAGGMLGIVSSKYRFRVAEALAKFGLTAITLVIGLEDVVQAKPAPEGIEKAIAHFGSAKPRTLFVGDSLYDGKAARNAGVDFAAVLNGTTPRKAFEGLPHVLIADSLTALADRLCE